MRPLKMSCVVLVISLFSAIVFGQEPAEVEQAPVPSQILHARKIFIANAEGDNDPRVAKYVGGPNGIYDQFYADVKNVGRFEMVSAPADADVVFQVTLAVFAVVSGYPRLKLEIHDPKTNVLLWTVAEPIDPAFLSKNARRNLVSALNRLTQDVSNLIPKQ